ncbi:MAG: DUF6326 family protein [Robiginitalea sp.]
MSSKKTGTESLRNYEINIKLKLASLWTALMFLYIYADYFRLMLLMLFSVILIIPALMIFLSVFLKPPINKWLNILTAFLYAGISILIIFSGIGDEWQAFFVLFNIVELLVLVMILSQAWKWPRGE